MITKNNNFWLDTTTLGFLQSKPGIKQTIVFPDGTRKTGNAIKNIQKYMATVNTGLTYTTSSSLLNDEELLIYLTPIVESA